MLEELYTAAPSIVCKLENTKVEPITISSQKKKGEGLEMELYKTVQRMPLEIVQGILLNGKRSCSH